MDADGHLDNPEAIRLTLEAMLSENLDVLTGVPFLPLRDFWSKIVMPVWNLYSEVSGRGIADANDPGSKVAFVMGSYFMIRKRAFESVGTYASVKDEIQEDASMGRLLKQGGYRIKMFKIDSLVTALWSRDLATLWSGIRRTVIPIAMRQKRAPLLQQFAMIGMIIFPFLLWPFSAIHGLAASGGTHQPAGVWSALFIADSALCLAVIITTAVKGIWKYRQSPAYSLLCAMGALFLVVCAAYSVAPIIFGKGAKPVSWRGRPHTFPPQGQGEPEAAPA